MDHCPNCKKERYSASDAFCAGCGGKLPAITGDLSQMFNLIMLGERLTIIARSGEEYWGARVLPPDHYGGESFEINGIDYKERRLKELALMNKYSDGLCKLTKLAENSSSGAVAYRCDVSLASLLYILAVRYIYWRDHTTQKNGSWFGGCCSNPFPKKKPSEMDTLEIWDNYRPNMKQHCGIDIKLPTDYITKRDAQLKSAHYALKGKRLFIHPVEKRVCFEEEIREFLKEEIEHLISFEELYDDSFNIAGIHFVAPSEKLKELAKGHLRVKAINKKLGLKIDKANVSCCEACDVLSSLLGL